MRILIVDDHPVLRFGLKQILADEFKTAEFGEADSAHEAIVRVRGEKWDAVVLDIAMPGHSAPESGRLETLSTIKSIDPKLPVLILSGHPEDQFALQLLELDASGYLTKGCRPAELVAAMRKMLAGGRYVSAALAEKMVSHLAIDMTKPPHERLSNREFQILLLIASGKSVGKIGIQLGLSPKTVSTYRTRILQKMDLTTSAQLMSYAIKNKLIERPAAT